MEKIVIIGAGVIGAALAFDLARRGCKVTVVDAGLPAQGASGRSFGWINASFALSDAHFALRVAGMEAHQRLARILPGLHQGSGCLWWEESGAEFEATARKLAAAGYPLQHLNRAQVLARVPALQAPPDQTLFFSSEGWVDAAALTQALLLASGAEVLSGVTVQIATNAGRTSGVSSAYGFFSADQVVIAAGLGAPTLLAPLGLALPMLHRPAFLLRTKPVNLRLPHILAAPDQELRQEPDGALLAPASASHQSDTGADLHDPNDLADAGISRIEAMLGLRNVALQSMTYAERPVPGDGLPVLGRVPGVEGLWLATLHSGVTLAAIVGEALGAEIAGLGDAPVLAPFRPERLLRTL